MKNIIIYIALLLILCGCAAKKSYSERILHDTVYRMRDSMVIRYVRDSVSERLQTGYEQKGDTVFVKTERIVERWRVQTDTVNVEKERAKVSHDLEMKKETVTQAASPIYKYIIYTLFVCFCVMIVKRFFS